MKLNLVSPENLIFRNNRLLAKRGEKKFIEYKELMNSHAHNNITIKTQRPIHELI